MAASAGSHAEGQTKLNAAGEHGLNSEAPSIQQQQQPFHIHTTHAGYGSEDAQSQGVQQQDGDAEQVPPAQQPQEQPYRSLTGMSSVLHAAAGVL